jgi:AcrR family transcriptional regulator
MTDPTQRAADETRRGRLCEAALSVFARYGFRKTSMEEIAQAAQISRQALYLHFSTKEDLFRATIERALERSVGSARAVLDGDELPLDERLIRAFDEWMGHFFGMIGSGASDLAEIGPMLAGPILARYEAEFVESLTSAIARSPLMESYRPAGLQARQLAETLTATARGLKHLCTTREGFVERVSIAVRALCAPLIRPA